MFGGVVPVRLCRTAAAVRFGTAASAAPVPIKRGSTHIARETVSPSSMNRGTMDAMSLSSATTVATFAEPSCCTDSGRNM